MKDLRLELRTRNNRLWHVIHDEAPTVAAFCRRHRLEQGEIGGWLNLTRSPYDHTGQPRKGANRVARVAKQLVEDLFPVALYAATFPRTLVTEGDSHQFVALCGARRVALPPTQETGMMIAEAHTALTAMLETLRPREASVLRMRFGLDHEEQTLAETATAHGLSTERVRQIEAKALRKLRHPRRAKHLRPVYDELIEEPR